MFVKMFCFEKQQNESALNWIELKRKVKSNKENKISQDHGGKQRPEIIQNSIELNWIEKVK